MLEIPLRPRSPLLYLQITEKLLEAEEKKLRVLKTEIEANKLSDAVEGSKKVIQYYMCIWLYNIWDINSSVLDT